MSVWACGEPLCKNQVDQVAPPYSCPACGRQLLSEDDPEYGLHVDKGLPIAPLMLVVDGHMRPARRADMTSLLGEILEQQAATRTREMRLLQTIIRVSAVAFIATGVAMLAYGMELIGWVFLGFGVLDGVVAALVGTKAQSNPSD